MARIYTFPSGDGTSCSEEFALRNAALSPLNKKGLMSYAVQSYEDTIRDPVFNGDHALQSPIVRDAYLYAMINVENHAEKSQKATGPNAVMHVFEQQILRAPKTIAQYGAWYLAQQGHDQPISDSLYAASFSYRTIKSTGDADTFKSIIGEEAYEIALMQRRIMNDVSRFEDVGGEVKLLHMSALKMALFEARREIDRAEGLEKDVKDKRMNNAAALALHVDALEIIPERSDLERVVSVRQDDLRQVLSENRGMSNDSDRHLSF